MARVLHAGGVGSGSGNGSGSGSGPRGVSGTKVRAYCFELLQLQGLFFFFWAGCLGVADCVDLRWGANCVIYMQVELIETAVEYIQSLENEVKMLRSSGKQLQVPRPHGGER